MDKLARAMEAYEQTLKETPLLPELPTEEQAFLEAIYDQLKENPDAAEIGKAEAECLLRGTFPEFFLTAPDDQAIIKQMAEERGIVLFGRPLLRPD